MREGRQARPFAIQVSRQSLEDMPNSEFALVWFTTIIIVTKP